MKLTLQIAGGVVAAIVFLYACGAVIDEIEYNSCVSGMKSKGYAADGFVKAGCRIGSKIN